MKKVFYFKAHNGGQDFGEFREDFKTALTKYEGRRFRVELEETTRTLSQNAYYWAYLAIIAKETGDDPEALHEHFKRRFAPRKFVKFRGKEYAVAKSTRTLKKWEFSEYLDRICAETNVPLPDPTAMGYIPNH